MSPAENHSTDDRKRSVAPPHVAVLEGPDPSGLYRADVLAFPLSLVVGAHRAASPDAALDALKARLAELGRPIDLAVFPDLESAREEVGRRQAASDLLAVISPPYRARVAALLPDRPHLLEATDALASALSDVASGHHAAEPVPETPVPETPVSESPFAEADSGGALAYIVYEAARDALGKRLGNRRALEPWLDAGAGENHDSGWYALWMPVEGVGEVEIRGRLFSEKPED